MSREILDNMAQLMTAAFGLVTVRLGRLSERLKREEGEEEA